MDRGKFLSSAAALTVATALLLTLAARASADDRSRCPDRVEKAQERYRHEAHEHGKHTPRRCQGETECGMSRHQGGTLTSL